MLLMLGFERSSKDYPEITSAHTRTSTTKKIHLNPANRKSLAIDYGKPLFITDQNGAKFELILHGVMGQPIKYEWASLADLNKGSGELLERLEVIAKTDNGVEVRDAGSEIVISILGLHLEWSPKNQSSGWLYFDSKTLSIETQRP